MSAPAARRRMLLVGGGGGLVGRALLGEFARDWAIRSVHRHPSPAERSLGVEWIKADVARVRDWAPLLSGVDAVVNVAWHRSGRASRFGLLAEGLGRLWQAAGRSDRLRVIHLSVPDAPPALEESLPYLSCKRRADRALEESGASYAILRPTMLYGPGDRLLTVMLRMMHGYRYFPMFGHGSYHVSPLASVDLARIVRREIDLPGSRSVLAGGPTRWRYRALTDRMYRAIGRPPRYWPLSARSSVRLARVLEKLGSRRLYAYEVVWLLSDLLGLPPYEGLGDGLAEVGPFLDWEGALLRGTPAEAAR